MKTHSTQEKYIRILAVILTPLSISQWLSISINSSIIRVISLTLCLLIIRYSFSYSLLFNSNYKIIKYYLIWVFISLIRGIIIAQSFWDYNLLSIGRGYYGVKQSCNKSKKTHVIPLIHRYFFDLISFISLTVKNLFLVHFCCTFVTRNKIIFITLTSEKPEWGIK